jgi:hypothetical protein
VRSPKTTNWNTSFSVGTGSWTGLLRLVVKRLGSTLRSSLPPWECFSWYWLPWVVCASRAPETAKAAKIAEIDGCFFMSAA